MILTSDKVLTRLLTGFSSSMILKLLTEYEQLTIILRSQISQNIQMHLTEEEYLLILSFQVVEGREKEKQKYQRFYIIYHYTNKKHCKNNNLKHT